ncbi:MAG: GNAT family N-acetyltransferase [Clostridiales bacterium]|nr:GNAT family N-acetyltransferase [Clostridiales bacterium]
MIRYADKNKKNETEELKRLFNVCFPGEESFCRWFFEKCFEAENTLVDVENGVLRGAAMELLYNIKGIGDVTYLYAVGTFPQFRGRGICGNIIKKSQENDRLRGRAASVLIPGDKFLFDFYRRLGYRESSFVTERKFTASENRDDLNLGECRAADLVRVYNENLKSGRYILRSEEYFERQTQMFKKFGGGLSGLYCKNRLLGYCFYSFEKGKIFFDEIIGEEKEALAGKILKKFGLNEGFGREPGKGQALGMAYFYGESFEFYMNLMYN